jgi:hypothetical protein
VWKKHRSFGLQRLTETNPMAAKVLKMIMCLPLLPSQNIPEGFRVVVELAQAENLLGKFSRLLNYIQDLHPGLWIDDGACDALSVFRKPHRTNNAVESFHRQLNEIVGRNPGFWDFLGKKVWYC